MKKLALAFIFLLAAGMAWAETAQMAIETASGSTLIGNSAQFPTAMPVVGTVTVSLASVTISASGTMPVNVASDGAVVGSTRTANVTVTSASQLLASWTGRVSVLVQNMAATESCYLNPGGLTATPGMGIELPAGAVFEKRYPPSISLPIVCTTTAIVSHTEDR